MSASMNKVLLGHSHLIYMSFIYHVGAHLYYKAELNSCKRDLKAGKPKIVTLALFQKKQNKKKKTNKKPAIPWISILHKYDDSILWMRKPRHRKV